MKKFLASLLILFSSLAPAQWDPFVNNGVFIVQDDQGVTLQCEDIILGTVLQTLADELKINILLTEPLTQPVTMNIRALDKEDILTSLLSAYSLQSLQTNNLTVILPAITRQTNSIKTFYLKYANAEHLSQTLKSRLQTGFDARTNVLIVYDNAEHGLMILFE